MINKDQGVNEKIKAKEVRLIDTDGTQLGIVSRDDALETAQKRNMDLVNVAPTAKPPVCRIMDYGKYQYEKSKREKEARKKQKTVTLKEVKVRPNIEEHDFQVKAKKGRKFLEAGDKVKVTVMFRGREVTHSENGKELCEKLAQELEDCAVVEKKPKLEGRNMIMIMSPRER